MKIAFSHDPYEWNKTPELPYHADVNVQKDGSWTLTVAANGDVARWNNWDKWGTSPKGANGNWEKFMPNGTIMAICPDPSTGSVTSFPYVVIPEPAQ